MDKLKPCPFCGNFPVTSIKIAYSTMQFTIKCKCGIEKTKPINIDVSTCFSDITKAIDTVSELWNRRVNDD